MVEKLHTIRIASTSAQCNGNVLSTAVSAANQRCYKNNNHNDRKLSANLPRGKHPISVAEVMVQLWTQSNTRSIIYIESEAGRVKISDQQQRGNKKISNGSTQVGGDETGSRQSICVAFNSSALRAAEWAECTKAFRRLIRFEQGSDVERHPTFFLF